MKQLAFLRKERLAYGGELLKTREGRRRGRPLDTRNTMHLILKSSHARGDWSFRRSANREKIRALIQRFSARYGVRVLSLANVGNHLHFQIRLTNRFTYPAFIRALTGAIAMAVTGSSRWKPLEKDGTPIRFWDYRPFTRVVQGLRGHLGLRDYIRINQFEGCGYRRVEARWLIARDRMKSRKAPDARAGPGPR